MSYDHKAKIGIAETCIKILVWSEPPNFGLIPSHPSFIILMFELEMRKVEAK